mmetsp:Transcript_50957/g.58437  ORF Transcript_50957/g.58437 Transcript_50957/m.58437 type:complete len:362 (-) Transcript_50957:1734-2819(-)
MVDTTNLEAPGREIEDDLETLREEVAEFFGVNPNVFVGAQPISLDSSNAPRIKKERFLVCEKTDGVRYLLYADAQDNTEICYLIDRKKKFWEVDISIPESARPCLLDGELIFDRATDKPEGELRFLLFDLMVVGGETHLDKSYDQRLTLAYDKVIKPQEEDCYVESDSIKLFLKDFFETSELKHLYDNIVPKLPHENDGLIFTKVEMVYKPGTHEDIIKWKPPELNSVDFYLFPDFALHVLGSSKKPEFYDQLYPRTVEEREKYSELIQNSPSGFVIVECGFSRQTFVDWKDVPHSNGWRLDRVREDKATANYITVVDKIRQSIDDNITIEKLEDEVNGDTHSANLEDLLNPGGKKQKTGW